MMDSALLPSLCACVADLASCDRSMSPHKTALLRRFAAIVGIDADVFVGMVAGRCRHADDISVEEKGLMFEKFVVSLLADRDRVKLVFWRSDKFVNGIYAEENLYPDLEVSHRLDVHPVEYFVECKYRSQWSDGSIDLSRQMRRYKRHARSFDKELFIALGIGGTPDCPEEFYLVPGRMIGPDNSLHRSRLQPCRCEATVSGYHRYVNHYYNRRVFADIQERLLGYGD